MLFSCFDKAICSLPVGILAGLFRIAPRFFFNWRSRLAFQNTVRYAYRFSPFYRKKFDELKIDPRKVRKPSDLGDFFTTPQDIIDNAESFLCRKPQTVFESSGTTGINKRVYFSQAELNHIGKMNAVGLSLGGIKKTDRMVNAFDFCIWIPGMITQKAIEGSGIFGMSAGKIEPMEVYKRIPVYDFNIVLGEPTWLIKLTEIAEKNGSYPLKFIIGGAEEMPDAARPWMNKIWQGAEVRMVYASVESGGIMAFEALPECSDYHINENDFLLEIINPGEDGYGEITFTTLSRTTMPLIRYRNRDVGRITDERCPCGLSAKRLSKIRGRTDELVVASGGNLYPLMFENILKDISSISTDWQIIFRLRGIKEVLEFNLELKEKGKENEVREKVFEYIKQLYPDLWKNYSIQIFEIDFVFHLPGTVRKNRKLIRVLDKRYAK